MIGLRHDVWLISLGSLLLQFLRSPSAPIAWAIVTLTAVLILEDYIPVPQAPRDVAQDQIEQIRQDLEEKIQANQSGTEEKLKELKNSVGAATLAAGLRPRPLMGAQK